MVLPHRRLLLVLVLLALPPWLLYFFPLSNYSADGRPWYSRQWGSVDGENDIGVIFLKHHPLSYLHVIVFGMVLAFIQVWILGPPTWYVLRGRKFKISLRHTEVLVLLGIGVVLGAIFCARRRGEDDYSMAHYGGKPVAFGAPVAYGAPPPVGYGAGVTGSYGNTNSECYIQA